MRPWLIVSACLFAATIAASHGGTALAQNTDPGEEGVLPPPWNARPCERPCVIYGVHALGAAAGVYAIDVCNRSAANILPVGGFANLAMQGPDALYLSTMAGVLYRWVIGSPSPPSPVPGGGSLGGSREVALTEGATGWLYGGTNDGTPRVNLYRRLPLGPTPLGPFRFPWGPGFVGDLAFSSTPNQRYPLIGIEPAPGGSNLVDVERSTGFHLRPRPLGAIFHGLAYDRFYGRLWASLMATPSLYTVDSSNGSSSFAFRLPTEMEDLASTPSCGTGHPLADLGDAPDSSNHLPDHPMSAYPGVNARFPTVFDPATGQPQGPLHWTASDSMLGPTFSFEMEADLPPDDDGVPNLLPQDDVADLDRGDDGVGFPIDLPNCGWTDLRYTVSVSGPATSRYANVWIDFNRDGEWGQVIECWDPDLQTIVEVHEWAVRNQSSYLGPGTFVVTSSQFRTVDPDDDVWMRVTLSESESFDADGRGAPGGFEVGETEDYLLHNTLDTLYAP